MTESLAEVLEALAAGYLALGLCFAAAFVTIGAARLDPAARGMRATVRAMLVPGATLLWPVLLLRWLGRRPGRDLRGMS